LTSAAFAARRIGVTKDPLDARNGKPAKEWTADHPSPSQSLTFAKNQVRQADDRKNSPQGVNFFALGQIALA
jgi:hypothetical protein